ncbi:MAG: hypothetical protein V1858_01955 [Candidatus Gottesmanbacteria bacterium]
MDLIPPEGDWSGTQRVKERLKGDLLFEEPYGIEKIGKFAERPIIARDTSINGGVYLGSGEREAIVVDDQKYPQELNDVYVKLKQSWELKQNNKSVFENVYNTVKEALGGNKNPVDVETQVNNLVASFTNKHGPDTKVPINDFIKAGVGVCRHRALLAGYLIERLTKQGILKGNVSIDRNYLPNLGGHAWVRWEAVNIGVIIIDPSLNYVGKIENAPKFWNYQRPGAEK